MSCETFMIFCSFVSEKLIAHPSLLKAHRSLYVMLNLLTLFNLLTLGKVQASLTLLSLNRKFQHLTASLYLSFSADVSKKNRGLRCPRFSIRCMDERQLFFMMLATMRWYCCSSSSISCIFSNMSACSRQQSMTEISPSWQALTKVSMLVCIRAAS